MCMRVLCAVCVCVCVRRALCVWVCEESTVFDLLSNGNFGGMDSEFGWVVGVRFDRSGAKNIFKTELGHFIFHRKKPIFPRLERFFTECLRVHPALSFGVIFVGVGPLRLSHEFLRMA